MDINPKSFLDRGVLTLVAPVVPGGLLVFGYMFRHDLLQQYFVLPSLGYYTKLTLLIMVSLLIGWPLMVLSVIPLALFRRFGGTNTDKPYEKDTIWQITANRFFQGIGIESEQLPSVGAEDPRWKAIGDALAQFLNREFHHSDAAIVGMFIFALSTAFFILAISGPTYSLLLIVFSALLFALGVLVAAAMMDSALKSNAAAQTAGLLHVLMRISAKEEKSKQ